MYPPQHLQYPYNITFYGGVQCTKKTNEENELMHYGVLGMKWGVRKNPTKAYHKSIYKRDRINRKAAAFDTEAAYYKNKSYKAKAGGFFRKPNQKNAFKYEGLSLRYELKAAKQRQIGQEWSVAMRSTFSDYKISRVPGERIRTGTGFTRGYVEKYKLTSLKK